MAQGSAQKKNGSVRDLAAFAIKTKLAAKAGLEPVNAVNMVGS